MKVSPTMLLITKDRPKDHLLSPTMLLKTSHIGYFIPTRST